MGKFSKLTCKSSDALICPTRSSKEEHDKKRKE
jgi:hypothetical protein